MEFALRQDIKDILELYKAVIDHVDRTTVRLGWNINIYPDEDFITTAVSNGEMAVLREDGRIIAAAVVNHEANPEYDTIDWSVKTPKEKIATIHALAVHPEKRGSKTSYAFLTDIEDHCRKMGDISIHLDVIDTNIPAYKLYFRNGYRAADCIKMYYESVGTREFWMMEHDLTDLI